MIAEKCEKGGNIKSVTKNGRCQRCGLPFEGLWVVGWREGALAKIIKDYKYKSVRAAAGVLAEMLDEVLPRDLGKEVGVVPLPTIGRHVRERGLDHTAILARKLAVRRRADGWRYERLLGRATDTVQVGAKVAERQRQAESTYVVLKGVDAGRKYLLVDDVWTTGATMLAAEKVLRAAGAKQIYGAVLVTGKAKEMDEDKPDGELRN